MHFLIGILVKGATVFLTNLIIGLASEKMIATSFFAIAESVAKSTKTEADDAWLKALKESYEGLNK